MNGTYRIYNTTIANSSILWNSKKMSLLKKSQPLSRNGRHSLTIRAQINQHQQLGKELRTKSVKLPRLSNSIPNSSSCSKNCIQKEFLLMKLQALFFFGRASIATLSFKTLLLHNWHKSPKNGNRLLLSSEEHL